MKLRTKLELTWIGKHARPRLEPRVLVEDIAKSHHASHLVGTNDIFENHLIFGDNLLALKALEQNYSGKVKCAFIDPPYNTGSAFEHYEDGVEHSVWLSLMRDRIVEIHKLLADDGSLWMSIDDNESHYLKVLTDEIFGRQNFVANCVWQKKYSAANDHKSIAPMHDHILVYQKSSNWKRNLLERPPEKDTQYKYSDEGGVYRISDYTCSKTYEERPNLYYPIKHPQDGRQIWPKKTRVWAYSKKQHQDNVRKGLVAWGATGKAATPGFKRYKKNLKNDGVIPHTWWPFEDAGHTDGARKEVRDLLDTDSVRNDFLTPKPEALVYLALRIATNPGDIVLDSFLGSGTTAAVAHKMGRRWIGIELGEHCHTHCIPRLQKVIDGEDPGGITKVIDWKGGGGFRYYKLAPSLLKKDKWGNWVINKDYNPTMLAQAVCKLEGFTYEPSGTHYWMHGHSSEQDFLYVTTATLKHAQLQQLSDEVGPERSLLVVCTSFRGSKNGYLNLSVKKIPKAVLNRCEWGKDDYSLRVENLPDAPPPSQNAGQQELLDGEEAQS